MQNTVTIENRHHDIADDEVGFFFLCNLHALLAVAGSEDIVISQLKDLRGVLAHVLIIFDQEYFFHLGKFTTILVPLFSSLRKLTEPCMISAYLATIFSPSPVPWICVALYPRKNLS